MENQKLFIVSVICKETKQTSTNIYSEYDVYSNYKAINIPSKLLQSKTIKEYTDNTYYTTITRVQ